MRVSPRYFASENLDSRLRAGLVGHWIGGGSGLTWFDRSGNGNHGALVNGPLWTLGQGGHRDALSFDGTNDYVDMGDPANGSLDFGTEDFSISAWVYPRALAVLPTIAAKQTSTFSDANGWSFELADGGGNGDVLFFAGGGGGGTLQRSTSGVLVLNQWQRVTAVIDYGNSVKLYIGTRELGALNTFSVWDTFSNTRNFNIGATGGTARRIDGVIDDVRAYNRALSTAEIALLANPSYSPIIPRR